MIVIDPRAIALAAVAPRATHPVTAIVHDSADARLVVFRLEAGQEVPPHTSPSTVMLTVIDGHGLVLGASDEQAARVGDVIVYAPAELHGMRALGERFVLLATITPRPGTR